MAVLLTPVMSLTQRAYTIFGGN